MKDAPDGLTVVIPAFNEAGAIRGVVEATRRTLKDLGVDHEVIVVDDASEDGTAVEAAAAGARVLAHPANAGYGAAILTGAGQARFELMAILDADGSYPPQELVKLLPHARQFDMVIGQRTGEVYRGGPLKRRGRGAFAWLARFVTGQSIPDVNSGMRVFHKRVLEDAAHIVCRGFSFSTTLTLSALTAGRFVKHVPITYLPRVGRSHVRYLRDTLRTAQILVQAAVFHNPTKTATVLAFLPVACGAVLVAAAGLARSALLFATGVACLLTALVIFVLGLVMDTLKMHGHRDG
ncbi:MAG TPA: glycosyltransferase family 2 protein [Candidatus Sulfotelmatobacter sp.]|nr:glycosyltransferase family 2 protein [Candidatus Sulfotelmatobacter sp.]